MSEEDFNNADDEAIMDAFDLEDETVFDRKAKRFSYEVYETMYHMRFGVQIACITFVNYNGTVIKKLMDRGTAKTNNQKFEIEKELNELIKLNYGKFNRPVSAFVTFTNQEAKEKCDTFYLKFDPITGKANKSFETGLVMDEIPLEVVDAPEPSDVIYENFDRSKGAIQCNECLLYMSLVVLVFFAGLLFVFLKLKSGKNNLMYPATFDCNSVYSLFGTPDAKGKFTKKSFTSAQNKTFFGYAKKDLNETRALVGGGFF